MALATAARATSSTSKAIAVLLGLFAAFLVQAGPAAAFTTHNRTSYESSIAWAVEHQLNAERHAHGLPALTMDAHLQLSARRHNMTMARFNSMSHQLPGEAFFATRIRQAGYQWTWAGENIAWNSQISTSGVEKLQTMMYDEKAPNNGHRLNILSSHFRNVGVDVYIDRTHGKVWLTTDFGRH
jgi:uncharacterized protein YkwD